MSIEQFAWKCNFAEENRLNIDVISERRKIGEQIYLHISYQTTNRTTHFIEKPFSLSLICDYSDLQYISLWKWNCLQCGKRIFFIIAMQSEDVKLLLSNELQAEVIGFQTNTALWEKYNDFCSAMMSEATDHIVEVKYWSEIKHTLSEHSLYPGRLINGKPKRKTRRFFFACWFIFTDNLNELLIGSLSRPKSTLSTKVRALWLFAKEIRNGFFFIILQFWHDSYTGFKSNLLVPF